MQNTLTVTAPGAAWSWDSKLVNALSRVWDIGTLATRAELERMAERLGADVAELAVKSELIGEGILP